MATVSSGSSDSSHSSSSTNTFSGTNLIINYFPQCYNEKMLSQTFGVFGPMRKCKLILDKKTGLSTSYGFVDYFNLEDAKRAMTALNGILMKNKELKVSVARPQTNFMKGSNLYIKNIPRSWVIEDLNDVFQPYGVIVNSRILTDRMTGASQGVGFVRYEEKIQAERALAELWQTIPVRSTESLHIERAYGGRSNRNNGNNDCQSL